MPDLTEAILRINGFIHDIVWGLPMMTLLFGTGLYFSIRTGFIQFRKFGYAMRNTIGKAFKKNKVRDKGAISPIQAVTTALAATVGTGNIAGVAGAISLGGPGAVFWMWVSALIGMVTKYAEVLLAVRFRERNKQGDLVGGPMYYIKNGLGKEWKFLAVIFSFFGAIAAFGAGNMTQVNTVAGSVITLIDEYTSNSIIVGSRTDMIIRLIVGFITAFVAALVLLGGMKRIGAFTEKLVPILCITYISCVLIVISVNIYSVIPALKSILIGAFKRSSVLGGAAGIGIMQTIKLGVGRGVFSNEAGLGSAPIAHAATSEKDPVKQGLFGIFEVFADTIVMCTLTALAILTSGCQVSYGEPAGVELTISAFAMAFGGKPASIIVTVCVILFATSTVLSWSLYGCRCAEFILGTKVLAPYKFLFIIFIVIGATTNLRIAWEVAGTLSGFMAIPNLIALIGLSDIVVNSTRKHFKEKQIK